MSGRQRGAALLMVLWVVALLSVMAATLLMTIGRSSRDAQQMLLRLQTQAAVDSALDRTIWQLTATDLREHPPLDGQFHGVEIVGGSAQVAVSEESGRVDLNTASPQLLEALLEQAGANHAQIQALSQGIQTLRKGERPALLAAADLHQLNGMTPELYRQLEPLVTVYTHAPAADPRYASVPVRKALVEAQLADRQILTQASAGAEEIHSVAGQVLRILVKVSVAEGNAQAQSTVLRLTGDPKQPCWLLEIAPLQ